MEFETVRGQRGQMRTHPRGQEVPSEREREREVRLGPAPPAPPTTTTTAATPTTQYYSIHGQYYRCYHLHGPFSLHYLLNTTFNTHTTSTASLTPPRNMPAPTANNTVSHVTTTTTATTTQDQ